MRQTLLCWLSILIFATIPAKTMGSDTQAWIETHVVDGTLRVMPMVKIQSAQIVRYELHSRKTGKAGTSDSRQAGTKSVACCEPIALASLRLGINPDDIYTLTLKVYVGNDLAAQDEIVYPPGREEQTR